MSKPAAFDPEYVAELERAHAALARENAELATANAALERSNTGLKRANTGLAEANARLERMLAQARHEKFGPSSERGDPDQRNLFTEDIEVARGNWRPRRILPTRHWARHRSARSPQNETREICRTTSSVSRR